MEPFRFRLQKVLDWQRTLTQMEELRTKQWSAALAQVRSARTELERSRVNAGRQVLAASDLRPQDLCALAEFRQRLARKDQELSQRQRDCEQRLAEQTRRWTQARQRCRLLEKLRERRLAEYSIGVERELETVAMESFTASLLRGRSLAAAEDTSP